MALGDDRFETFHNRIFAYVLIAEPNVTAVDTANPSIRWTFSFLGRNLATNPGRFPLALRSINRATTYAKAILETPWPLHASTSKFSYGFNMAVLGCRTLMAAHVLRLHLEYPGEIRVLRNYAASFVASSGRDLEIYRSAPNATIQHSLDVLAGYWSATPEQAAKHWLDILRPDRALTPRQMSDRRYGMLSALEMEGLSVSQSVISGVPLRPLRPLIIDWTSLDNTKGEAVWQNVLAQLSASKSLFNQFDSLALAIHTTPWGEAHDKALLALLDFFERKRDLLPKAEGQAFFSAYKSPFESNGFPQGFAERYCGLLETILTTAPDAELPLLSRASVLLGRFLSPHQPAARRLPQASAEKLLQTLNSHAARRAASGKLTNGNTTYETEIRKLTAVIINAYPVLEKPQPANSRGLPANGDAIRVLSLAPVQDENSQVKRHWMLGRGFTFGDLFLNPRILGPEVDAVCMKPDLTRIEIPAVPKDLFHHRFDSSFPNAHSLQPTRNGFLMLSRLGTLLGYDYKERKWSDESRLLPVHLQDIFETHRLAHGYNMAGYTQPTIGLVGDTLYFGTKDSGHTIGRMVNGQYQLIASSHRRPAEHPLDELPPSEVIAFFPGFQGSPYAMLRLPDRCEVHDLDRRRRVATFMFHSRLSFNGNVAVVSNDYMVAVMDPASEKPRCLIRRPPESGWGDRTTQDDLALETTWPWSPVMSGRNVCSGVHGDCLFILKYARGPVGGSRMGVSTNSDDKMNLYCFRPGQREPLEIPLMIDPEALTKFFPKGVDPSSHTSKVEVITESLEMSPAGMFFYIRVENPMALGSRGLAPDLLCVTWKQVDDWLTRHGHPPIGTRSTKGIAPAPR